MLLKLNPHQYPIPVDIPTAGSSAPRISVTASVGPVVAVQYGQLVAADPTAGNITANLPAANSVTATGSNTVSITNNADSANIVNVTPAGADTINGSAAAFVLAARETITLVSDGISEWFVF